MILDKKSPTALAEMGIVESSFVDEEAAVFRMIRSHYEVHGVLPHVRTVEEETEIQMRGFPEEPLSYWVERVLRRNQRKLIIQKADEAKKCAQDDEIDDARSSLQECLFDLDSLKPSDQVMSLSSVASTVLSDHDKRRRSVRMSGVPTGLPYLDQVTDGYQPGDSVAIVARPGIGKTYVLLKAAMAAWDAGYTPLFYSMEMAAPQLVRRMIALRTGVPATHIRKGRLSHFARKKLVEDVAKIKELESQTPFYLLQGDLVSTVEDLVLRVRELKPTALYVDGAYLLRTRSKTTARWDRVTETAEVLKRTGVSLLIPTVSTYQFNRRGPGSLGNIGLSDAVGQLASIVCALADEQDGEREATFSTRTYKTLQLLKGREGEKGTIKILFDMEKMLIQQEEIIHGEDNLEL